MDKTLIFIDNNTDISDIDTLQLDLNDNKVFSFNIHTHKFLENKGISHEIGETYLNEKDHQNIFDQTVSYWEWFNENPAFQIFEFENVNLLSVLGTEELHQIIIRELYIFLTMKRIIEKNKPQKIITSVHFSKLLKPLITKNNIIVETKLKSNHEFLVSWNKFLIPINIGKLSFSISISRSTFSKIKNFLELLTGKFFGLWLDIKKSQKIILFIEFDPSQYVDLIKNLKKNHCNLLFLNRRRTAIWNLKSIKTLKNFGCKIISPENFLTNEEKFQTTKISNDFLQKLEKIWKTENQLLSKLFSIENISFWPSISDILFNTYKNRFLEYLLLIKFSNKLLTNVKFSSIVSLNTMGETEKTILNINKNKIPTILLEHGSSDYLPEISRFDVTSGYRTFKDKIAVWNEFQKNYLIEHRKISEDRIFVVGSPRHDSFFNQIIPEKKNIKKNILIALPAIAETNFISDTTTYVRLEKLLSNLFMIIKNMPNVNLIVKLHPVQDSNNQYIKKLIQKLDPNIPIYQIGSIKNIIELCDLMINIHIELMPSTVMLEGLILKKPILNVIMMDKIQQFQYVKDDAVLSKFDKFDLNKPINDLLFNYDLSEKLVANGQEHIKKFLVNQGTASKSFADILNNFE